MLTLPIKKKWFDMILSAEKKEEYREVKPYYTSRFEKLGESFDVMFRNGYSSKSPSFIASVHLRKDHGREIWGAEKGVLYFVLEIKSISSVQYVAE